MTDQRNGRPGRSYDENPENWAGDKPAVTNQAIEAALKSWFGEGYQGGRLLGVSATFDIRSEMRAALEAALPHMVPVVKASDIIHQIALWSDDEGLELSFGQGDDLARRIMSVIEGGFTIKES